VYDIKHYFAQPGLCNEMGEKQLFQWQSDLRHTRAVANDRKEKAEQKRRIKNEQVSALAWNTSVMMVTDNQRVARMDGGPSKKASAPADGVEGDIDFFDWIEWARAIGVITTNIESWDLV
jgi:hypothetical protein